MACAPSVLSEIFTKYEIYDDIIVKNPSYIIEA